MSLHHMTGLTPHLTEVDLEHLEGHTVLGEPLPVLMSVALELRFVPVRDGLSHVHGMLSAEEIDTLRRAMTRVDTPPSLPPDEQETHRLAVVLVQACLATATVVRSLLAQPA